MKMTHVVMAAVAAAVISSTVTAAVIYDDNFATDPFAAPARWDKGEDPIRWAGSDANRQYMFFDGHGNLTSTEVVAIDTNQTNTFSCDYYFTAGGLASVSMYAFTQDSSEVGYFISSYMQVQSSDSRWYKDDRLTIDPGQTGWTQNMQQYAWYTFEMEIIDDTANERSVISARVIEVDTGTTIATFYAYDDNVERLTTHTGLIVGAGQSSSTKPTRVDNVLVSGTIVPDPATCQEVIDLGLTLPADLNNDCYVEWADFGIFASQWQMCNNPEDANCE